VAPLAQSEGRRRKAEGGRQKIFDFPFTICHFSMLAEALDRCPKMTDDKWKMENEKSFRLPPSAFCLLT